jgi:hypothetical protein
MRLKCNKIGAISRFCKEVGAFIGDFIDKHHIAMVSLIFLASFLVKMFVLNSSGALGADYGAYLRWADVVKGLDVVGKGLRYPPIYPILLNLFLAFLDEITALKVCAALVYSLVAVPYFFATREMFGGGVFPVVASLLITFNMFYSEMMGWGGNANVLAFAFLIAFLIFWVNGLKGGSKRDIILAAFFLSLAVGSHYLLAAYLLFFFLVFLSLILLLWRISHETLAFKPLAKNVIMIGLIGLAFSVPYIFTYKHLLNSAATHETNFTLADQRTLGLSFYVIYQSLLNIVFVILGIIGIGFLIKENKPWGLTLAVLFISGCLPIFFTLHPARWVLFWPIPIFLGVIAFIRDLALKLKRVHRIIRVSAVISMAFLIFVYMLCSVPYLYDRVFYYGILKPQFLDALEYIKWNTAADSVIATSGPFKRGGEGGGHNYGWWIEGYADRRSVATSYLRFLIYYDEREIAENANILFSGTYVLLNDFVMAAETLPAGLGNPEISVNIGDFYEKLLFFADNETIITCGSNNITLSSAKWNTTFTGSIIETVYNKKDLILINRDVYISDDSTIEVSFKINQGNGIDVTKISIPLFRADFVDLNSYCNISDKHIALDMTTSIGAYVKLNIIVDYEGRVALSFPKVGQKFVLFTFNNPKGTIKFRFILPKLVSAGSGQMKCFNAYELIEQMGIDYIMVNVNRRREFEWFSKDKSCFLEVFENEEIAIFKVITKP